MAPQGSPFEDSSQAQNFDYPFSELIVWAVLTRAQCYKTFSARNFANFCNKLEYLSLASVSSIVDCLLVKMEPILLNNLSDAPLLGKLLALPTNNRLGCRGLPGVKALAYYENRNLRK
jgi:hypothetical protein